MGGGGGGAEGENPRVMGAGKNQREAEEHGARAGRNGKTNSAQYSAIGKAHRGGDRATEEEGNQEYTIREGESSAPPLPTPVPFTILDAFGIERDNPFQFCVLHCYDQYSIEIHCCISCMIIISIKLKNHCFYKRKCVSSILGKRIT